VTTPEPDIGADLQALAAWYGWYRLHDVWLYESLYLHGDERLRRFVPPGDFVPFAERWSSVSMVP
jgi:hypothetical protein